MAARALAAKDGANGGLSQADEVQARRQAAALIDHDLHRFLKRRA